MSRVQVAWRRPGGRKPADVVYVGRPSRWGNPYPVAEHGREQSIAAFTAYAQARLAEQPDWLDPLKGKRLACYCKPDEDCHADVLLTLLAEEPPA